MHALDEIHPAMVERERAERQEAAEALNRAAAGRAFTSAEQDEFDRLVAEVETLDEKRREQAQMRERLRRLTARGSCPP